MFNRIRILSSLLFCVASSQNIIAADFNEQGKYNVIIDGKRISNLPTESYVSHQEQYYADGSKTTQTNIVKYYYYSTQEVQHKNTNNAPVNSSAATVPVKPSNKESEFTSFVKKIKQKAGLNDDQIKSNENALFVYFSDIKKDQGGMVIQAIKDTYKSSIKLRYLGLENMNISDDGGAALVEFFKTKPNIKEVIVDNNNLSELRIEELIMAGNNNKNLEKLSVIHNNLSAPEKFEATMKPYYRTGFEVSIFEKNNLKRRDHVITRTRLLAGLSEKQTQYLAEPGFLFFPYVKNGDQVAKAFMEAFRKPTSFKLIGFHNMDMSDTGGEVIRKLIETKPDIKEMSLEGNKFSDEVKKSLQETADFNNIKISL